MIGHGQISSYDGDRARVISLDRAGYVTAPFPFALSILNERPEPGTLVVYAEFTDGTGAILAIMEG